MNNVFFRIKSYFKHRRKAHPHGGHGIHSPFVFDFVTHVLEEKLPYYAYAPIEKLRRNLLADKSIINVKDYGSRPSRKRRICDMAAQSCKSANEAQLLFRMAVKINPQNILELGTCLGITTAYLAKSDSRAKLTSMEGSPETAKTAAANLKSLGIKNAKIVVGNIDEKLSGVLKGYDSLDMVFLDANHRGPATLKYFNACAEKMSDKGIIVVDDIYYSPDMQQAWQQITKHPKVRVSVDLYDMGVLFFNPEIQRGSYVLRT